MSDPTCPAHYLCTFTPQQKFVVTHNIGAWWHGSGGLVVTILGIVAIAVAVIVLIVMTYDALGERADREQREHEKALERKHDLEMQEQRTMQIDAAKGNPEMLKIVKEMQR